MTNRTFTIKNVGGDPLYRAKRAMSGNPISHRTHQTVILPSIRLYPGKSLILPLFVMRASKKEIGDALDGGVCEVWVNTDKQIPFWRLNGRSDLVSALGDEWEPPASKQPKSASASTDVLEPVKGILRDLVAMDPAVVTEAGWTEIGDGDTIGVTKPEAATVEVTVADILAGVETGSEPAEPESPALPPRDILLTWTMAELRAAAAQRNMTSKSTSKSVIVDALLDDEK